MTVEAFPSPEPWPAELFDLFGTADLEQLIADAQTVIDDRQAAAAAAAAPDNTYCGDCGDALHPGETVCAGCGSHVIPKNYDRGCRPNPGVDPGRQPQKETG